MEFFICRTTTQVVVGSEFSEEGKIGPQILKQEALGLVFFGSIGPISKLVLTVVIALVLILLLSFHGESRKPKCDHHRAHSSSITDFGGIGDGKTSNSEAFKKAITNLSQFSSDGGGGSQLIVPEGKWLTSSFNLTSHFTLYLRKDAFLLASQDENDWTLIEPLPSYGRGRDAAGGRYISLIFGTNLTDVVITGENGTIDGQGEPWWKKFRNGELNHTRPYLIELMHSDNIVISNLTLVNSPSWNVHPVYCRNVIIQGLTILASVTSPNTDGINPDSCTNTKIEDCYIVSGDDCIAVKSGWDQYGISYGMPTKQLVIRRLTCISPTSAVIALGSEMSGGIEDVRAEDILAINSESGVRIKSAPGRGGYVKDIYVRRMTMKTMKWVFWMTGNYGDHPDDKYDPKALPVVKNINYRDMVAENVTMSARLEGISGDPFTGICVSNVTIGLSAKPKKLQWNCTYVEGVSGGVSGGHRGARVGKCPSSPATELRLRWLKQSSST